VRAIEIPFVCDQRGDCCRHPPFVLMTEDEAVLLEAARDRATRELDWQEDEPSGRFVKLMGKPCPFLDADGLCAVYEIRPYNCRRFICGRPSGSSEPWQETRDGRCANVTERLSQSVAFFRHADELQTAAQPWALAHGWVR
jgi:Fe-S-cluster containining protein